MRGSVKKEGRCDADVCLVYSVRCKWRQVPVDRRTQGLGMSDEKSELCWVSGR